MAKEVNLTGALLGSLITLSTALYPAQEMRLVLTVVSVVSALVAVFLFLNGLKQYFAEQTAAVMEQRKLSADNFQTLCDLIQQNQNDNAKDIKQAIQSFISRIEDEQTLTKKSIEMQMTQIDTGLQTLQDTFKSSLQSVMATSINNILETSTKNFKGIITALDTIKAATDRTTAVSAQNAKNIVASLSTLQTKIELINENQTALNDEIDKMVQTDAMSNKITFKMAQQINQTTEQNEKLLENVTMFTKNSNISLESQAKIVQQLDEMQAIQKEMTHLIEENNNNSVNIGKVEFTDEINKLLSEIKMAIEGMYTSISAIKGTISNVNNEVSGILNNLLTLDEQAGKIQMVNEIKELLANISETNTSIKSDSNRLIAYNEKHNENLSEIINKIKEITNKVSTPNERAENIKLISEILTDIDEIGANIKENSDKLVKHNENSNENLAEINDNINSVNGKLSELNKISDTMENVNSDVANIVNKLPNQDEQAKVIKQIMEDTWHEYETLTERDIKLLNDLVGKVK